MVGVGVDVVRLRGFETGLMEDDEGVEVADE